VHRPTRTQRISNKTATLLISGGVSAVTALITALATTITTERQLQRQYKLEFSAEQVARELLMDPQWRLRSFEVIKHQLPGFEDNELRKILVRSGAIRIDSKSGKEREEGC